VDGTNANGATNTPSSTNEQLNKDQNVESWHRLKANSC
jgi:hypothetical protein